MTDEASLLLILWAIYWIELAIWLPGNGILFRLGRQHSPAFATNFPGNARGSIRLNHIIPWFQLTSIGRQALVALSPEVVSNQSLGHWTWTYGSQKSLVYAYSEIEQITLEGTQLNINHTPFINCFTKTEAKRHQALIEDLAQTPQSERHRKIHRYYEQRFPSVDDLARQVNNIQSISRKYRALSSLLFAYAFIICPIAYYCYPSPQALLGFLLSSVVFGWGLSLQFYRTHLKLCPEERAHRVHSTLKQLFCFPVAVGAGKDLCLHHFASYDPLVLAKSQLSASHFQQLSQKIWLDLKYPVQTDKTHELPINTYTYAQAAHRDATAQFLTQSGLNLQQLEQPAAGWELSTTCYCPRCQVQFQTQRTQCTDCPGVATRTVPAPPNI